MLIQAPGIAERAEPIDERLERTPLPAGLGAVVDLAPLDGFERSVWLMLLDDGRLVRFDADALDCAVIAASTVPAEQGRKPFCGHRMKRRLHASTRGEFAVVVNDYGQYGQVLDLRTGRMTLTLDGGDYYAETVPFSFAFVETAGRVVAVHRTAWNRLDVSDPATGDLLTERSSPNARTEDAPGSHDLDYFHGALHVSPMCSHVLDDGWVWHPVGMPTTWNLQRWILENPWESEDGPTKLDCCARSYYWDHGMVWIDETRVAIGGIGDDDDAMVAGARVFDITSRGNLGEPWREDWPAACQIATVAGPAGQFFSDGIRLFSSDPTGLSRWDVASGARTGRLPTFQPTHHHRGAGELVQLSEGVLVRWAVG